MIGKLYYQDPYLRTFTATIIEHGKKGDGTPYVVLDQTAFYPTGGGQPSDRGTIAGVQVTDVEEVDGKIQHRLAGFLPEGEATVEGVIAWGRRFDHMQQHLGQHILSAAFEQLFDVETVGFHMGEEIVTIDLNKPDLTEAMITEAERLANKIVFENRVVTSRFVDPTELSTLPLRKAPTVSENIRIVTVTDFDYSPCGGTHPARTGEVGPIKALSYEKSRGNIRLTFVCGLRTIRVMNEKQNILKELCRMMTCGEAELVGNLTKLQTERKELDHLYQEAKTKLLHFEAHDLLGQASQERGVSLIVKSFADRPVQELQKLSQMISESAPAAIQLFVTGKDRFQLLFACGSDILLPMNELLKETVKLINGKGGGNVRTAQGGGEKLVSAEELLDFAKNKVKVELAQEDLANM
jgi:alanyl-tRNA synthetase